MAGANDIAIITVHGIAFIVNIVGNFLVCLIIKRNRDMRYAEINLVKLQWYIKRSNIYNN